MADGAASERGFYHFRMEREVEGLAQILVPAPHNGQAVFEVYTSQDGVHLAALLAQVTVGVACRQLGDGVFHILGCISGRHNLQFVWRGAIF